MLQAIKKKIIHLGIKVETFLSERNSREGVKYIYENNHSGELAIIFSGIGNVSYNYRRSLKHASCDRIFIKDSWADGVSYYVYENGESLPEEKVSAFIERILNEKKYKRLYTIGSSKGGYAAVYYGLKYNADLIYAGACQYNLGDYLANHEHPEYYAKVTGKERNDESTSLLNNALPRMIEQHRNSTTLIHLLYSKNEHTYQDHIVDLIKALDQYNIKHTDYIETFKEHYMVGGPFKQLIAKSLR